MQCMMRKQPRVGCGGFPHLIRDKHRLVGRSSKAPDLNGSELGQSLQASLPKIESTFQLTQRCGT